MKERILYDAFLFFMVLNAPYWLYLPCIFLGIIIFPLFWESIIFSLFVDFFYGQHTNSGSIFSFPFGLIASLFVLIVMPVKDRFRFLR